MFPTVGVIDDFNRANENPIAAPWTIVTGTPDCQILANEFAISSGTYGQAFYSSISAADVDAFATIVVKSGDMLMMFRMGGTSDSTKFGYEIIVGATTIVLNTHPAGGGGVTLISSTTTAANGDRVGGRAIGTSLELWHKPSAGSWTRLGTATDSTFTAAGYLNLQCANTTARWDNAGYGVSGYKDSAAKLPSLPSVARF